MALALGEQRKHSARGPPAVYKPDWKRRRVLNGRGSPGLGRFGQRREIAKRVLNYFSLRDDLDVMSMLRQQFGDEFDLQIASQSQIPKAGPYLQQLRSLIRGYVGYAHSMHRRAIANEQFPLSGKSSRIVSVLLNEFKGCIEAQR
jgi:hypothetical protein